MAEFFRNRPGRLVAKLVTRVAAVGLDDVQPLALTPERHRHAVAVRARAGELALLRHLEHGVPVDGRVIFRRGGRIRRHHRFQIYDLARYGSSPGRIHQPVASHPDAVRRLRKVGHHVAAPIVGDHDLDEFREQVGRLGDHPHAGLGSVRARDHAADIVVVDADYVAGGLLGTRPAGRDGNGNRERKSHQADRHASRQRSRRSHGRDPPDGRGISHRQQQD